MSNCCQLQLCCSNKPSKSKVRSPEQRHAKAPLIEEDGTSRTKEQLELHSDAGAELEVRKGVRGSGGFGGVNSAAAGGRPHLRGGDHQSHHFAPCWAWSPGSSSNLSRSTLACTDLIMFGGDVQCQKRRRVVEGDVGGSRPEGMTRQSDSNSRSRNWVHRRPTDLRRVEFEEEDQSMREEIIRRDPKIFGRR